MTFKIKQKMLVEEEKKNVNLKPILRKKQNKMKIIRLNN